MTKRKLPIGIRTFREIRDTLLRRGVASPELDGMVGTDALLSAFDVDEMATEAVLFDDRVYLFELKTVEKAPEGAALAQLAEKGYADKYRSLGHPIHLVGVEFSREERNVAAFAVERA